MVFFKRRYRNAQQEWQDKEIGIEPSMTPEERIEKHQQELEKLKQEKQNDSKDSI